MKKFGMLLLALLCVPFMGHAEERTITCQKPGCEEYKGLEPAMTHSLSVPINENLDFYRLQGTNRGKFSVDLILSNQEYD